jgi:hypothetical protein
VSVLSKLRCQKVAKVPVGTRSESTADAAALYMYSVGQRVRGPAHEVVFLDQPVGRGDHKSVIRTTH